MRPFARASRLRLVVERGLFCRRATHFLAWAPLEGAKRPVFGLKTDDHAKVAHAVLTNRTTVFFDMAPATESADP